MSATGMASRAHVQAVVRLVTCPRCKAMPGQPCVSGTQFDGRYQRYVPNSHMGRWKACIDAGHMPDQMEQLHG